MFSRIISRAVRVSLPFATAAGSRKLPNSSIALFSNNRFLIGHDPKESMDLVKLVKEGGDKLKIPVSDASPEVKQYITEWRARNPEFVSEWKSKMLRHFNRDMELIAIQEKQQRVMEKVEKKSQEKMEAIQYLEQKILADADLKAQLEAKLDEVQALRMETLKRAEEDPVFDAQLKTNPDWEHDLNATLQDFLEEKLQDMPELHAKWVAFKDDILKLREEMLALDKSYKETELSVAEGHKEIFFELTDMMQRYDKVQEEWKLKEMESPQLVDQLRHEFMLQLLIEGKPQI